MLGIALPVCLAMLSQTAVMIADTAMTGRLGVAPQAAAGMGGMVIWTVMSFLMGAGIGVQILTARREGEKDYAEAGSIFISAILAGIVLALILGTAGYLQAETLMFLLTSRSELLQKATPFLQIRFLGLPFFLLAAIMAGFFDGLGRTRIAMLSALVIALSNIFFNWIFIYGNLGIDAYGIRGAAMASNISGLLGILVFLIILPQPSLRRYFNRSIFKFRLDVLRRIIKISFPTAMEGFLLHLSFLGFYRLASEIGSVSVAATNIVISIMSMSFMPGYAFGIAATTLVGQALGAKKQSLARQATIRAAQYAVWIMSTAGLLMLLWPRLLISFFTSDQNVIEEAIPALIIISLAQAGDALQMVYGAALRGAGKVYWVMYTNSIVAFLIMLPCAYLLGVLSPLGTFGLWSAVFLLLILLAGLFYYKFQKGDWARSQL